MNNNVFVSTGAFKTKNLNEIIKSCLDNGFYNLELSSGLDYISDTLESIKQHRNNSMRYLIHNYFPPPTQPFVLNLAAEEQDILQKSRNHCLKAIDLSFELGSEFYSIHSGFAFKAELQHLGNNFKNVNRTSYEKAYETFVESVRILADYSSSKNKKLVVENNVITRLNLVNDRNVLLLMVTADDLIRLHKDVSKDNLGFLIDLGHLNVSSNTLSFDKFKFIDRVKDYIVAFHISDNNGEEDQNLQFDNSAWFMPILKDLSFATMIIEAYKMEALKIQELIQIIEPIFTS